MDRLLQWLRDHRPHLKRIDLVPGNVYKFEKSKNYVIAFDSIFVTKEECQALSRILHNKGVTNVTCVVGRADPTKSIVVMENDR